MMLSETLLDVASFFDYASLVVLRLTSKQLLRFAARYAEKLAFRRTFNVSYWRHYHTQLYRFIIAEVKADKPYAVLHKIELDLSDNERIADAAAELQSHIGPHDVRGVSLYGLNFSLKLLVDLVPPLRFASEIGLSYAKGSSPTSQEYSEVTLLFERPICARFYGIPIEAMVVFLRSANASRLTTWSAWAPPAEGQNVFDAPAEDTIIRTCTSHELDQLTFVGWNLRWNFLRRLIEAAEDAQHVTAIVVSVPRWVPPERLTLSDGFTLTYWRLPLDPGSFEEKAVAIHDFLRHGQHSRNPWTKLAYFSKRSNVVVFVEGNILTITNNSSYIDMLTR